MSSRERTGRRDLTYSAWHREKNTSKYLGLRGAYELGMIDIDDVEWCRYCKQPVALIETQRSYDDPKEAQVTANLANAAGIPAYSVSYNDGNEGCCGIHEFKVRRVAPAISQVKTMTPYDYAMWLHGLREAHPCRAAA